jgi:hypothetical protein
VKDVNIVTLTISGDDTGWDGEDGANYTKAKLPTVLHQGLEVEKDQQV